MGNTVRSNIKSRDIYRPLLLCPTVKKQLSTVSCKSGNILVDISFTIAPLTIASQRLPEFPIVQYLILVDRKL